MLIVGTYRPSEDPGHPLVGALTAFEQAPPRGLGEDDVADIISATTGISATPDVVAAVRDRTEGNPFFATELAQLLRREQGRLPESVRAGVLDVVRQRVGRLSERTSALLTLGAVVGRDFELRVLARAAELDAESAVDLLDAALVTGIVVRVETVRPLRFNHDLVREAVLEGTSAVRRARLHGRVATAVESLHADDAGHVVQLAHHFFHTAPAVGPDKGIAYARKAAEIASRRLAHEQADEQLRRARELVGRLAPGEERDRQELGVLIPLRLLLIATHGYGNPEAGELLARAHALCLRLGETHQLVGLLFGRMGAMASALEGWVRARQGEPAAGAERDRRRSGRAGSHRHVGSTTPSS